MAFGHLGRYCTGGQTSSPQPSDTLALVPESTAAIGKTLAKVPIFSGLEESELTFLAQRTVLRNYSAGQSVFGEGEPCTGLYVVEAVHVRIFKSSGNGREQVLNTRVSLAALRFAPNCEQPPSRIAGGQLAS